MEDAKKADSEDPAPSCENISLSNKIIINSIEPVKIFGKDYLARIDTGAKRCSICKTIAKEINLGNKLKSVHIKNAHGTTKRDIFELEVNLAGVKTKAEFSIADRTSLQFQVLIGRNILKQGFLVDCSNENENRNN